MFYKYGKLMNHYSGNLHKEKFREGLETLDFMEREK